MAVVIPAGQTTHREVEVRSETNWGADGRRQRGVEGLVGQVLSLAQEEDVHRELRLQLGWRKLDHHFGRQVRSRRYCISVRELGEA